MLRKTLFLTISLFVVGGLIALGLDLIQRSPIKPALAHDYSNTWEIKWVVGGTEYDENDQIEIADHGYTHGNDVPFEVKLYKDGSNVTSNFYFAHSMLGYVTTQTGHLLKIKVEDAGRGEKGIVYLASQTPSTTETVRITTYAYYAAEDRFVSGSVYFKHYHTP